MTEVSHRDDQRPVFVGTRAEVVAMLRAAREAGRLVSWSDPAPAPGAPGRVVVRVQLAQRPTRCAPTGRRVHPGVWAAVAVAAVMLLGAAGWAVWALLSWAAANAATIGGALVLAALVLTLAGGGACTVVVRVTHRH